MKPNTTMKIDITTKELKLATNRLGIINGELYGTIDELLIELKGGVMNLTRQSGSSCSTASIDVKTTSDVPVFSINFVEWKPVVTAFNELETCINVFDNKIILMNGKSRITLWRLAEELCNAGWASQKIKTLEIGTYDFALSIKQTSGCAQLDRGRLMLESVFLCKDGENLVFVGTDGSHIGVKKIKIDGDFPEIGRKLIPLSLAKCLRSITGSDGERIKIGFIAEAMLIKARDYSYRIPLLKLNYPQHEKVACFVDDEVSAITVNRKLLLDELGLSMLVARMNQAKPDGKVLPIELKVNGNKLVLKLSNASAQSEYVGEIDIKNKSQKSMQFSLSIVLICQALRGGFTNDEEVRILFPNDNRNKPIIICNGVNLLNKSFKVFIMPMKNAAASPTTS